jgi:S-adenosylmethionine synthetase
MFRRCGGDADLPHARAIVAESDLIDQADCYLLSQIGHPIDDPQLLDIKVRVAEPEGLPAMLPRVADIARAEVASAGSLWRDLIEGGVLAAWGGRTGI